MRKIVYVLIMVVHDGIYVLKPVGEKEPWSTFEKNYQLCVLKVKI